VKYNEVKNAPLAKPKNGLLREGPASRLARKPCPRARSQSPAVQPLQVEQVRFGPIEAISVCSKHEVVAYMVIERLVHGRLFLVVGDSVRCSQHASALGRSVEA
jgi:hypothetical protein